MKNTTINSILHSHLLADYGIFYDRKFKKPATTVAIPEELTVKYVYLLGDDLPHLTSGSVSYRASLINAGNNQELRMLINSVYFSVWCFICGLEGYDGMSKAEPPELDENALRIFFIPSHSRDYPLLGAIYHYKGSYLLFSPIKFDHLKEHDASWLRK